MVLAWALAAAGAGADGIRWLLPDPGRMVAGTQGMAGGVVRAGGWEGTIADPHDPGVILQPVTIRAAKERLLYIRMACEAGVSLQVFFAAEPGRFSEADSFRVNRLRRGPGPVTYLLDLSRFPGWRGTIRSLRLDIDGAPKGALVRLYGVGVSARPIVPPGEVVRAPITTTPRVPSERMAAWHETIVATDEHAGISGAMTYVKERFTYTELYQLAKLVPTVEVGGRTLTPDQADEVRVDDFPGGVKACFRLGSVRVTTEIVPLKIGRGTPEQEGAILYTVTTAPPAPLTVECGEGAVADRMRPTLLAQAPLRPQGDRAQVEDGAALLSSSKHPFTVAARGEGGTVEIRRAEGGQYAALRFPSGSGRVRLGFAKDRDQAQKLARMDAGAARREVAGYYRRLLQCRVDTPVGAMNAAFRSALYNLEYNWIAPYGWNECIHHWEALWHMQATAGAEWIGQADRSRLCTLTTAEHLLPDGAIPQFMPNGSTKRDFGGSNQYWGWQVPHYWGFTADRDFARRVAPALDRVIEQTFAEHDADGNGLLGWGLQIGNQEDYVATPHDGTTPTVEGINLLRTRLALARALADDATAQRCQARIATALGNLRRSLWLPDLGRFAYFRDAHGVVRPDGQYHSLIYPVLWGITDPLDSWTCLRHLRDTLTGPKGNVYLSNNFPNHVGGTWGMQTGMAQQPWAAWGLAAAGLRNEAWRPLRAAADWVMDENHRGSWPEVADEPTPAYFSPPAGLFVAATVEALFGLQVHRPEGYLRVAPCFPDAWPRARLSLPDYSAAYTREGNVLEYVVTSRVPLARRLRWHLRPARVTRVQVDGAEARFTVRPGVGTVVLSVDTPPSRRTRFTVTLEPLDYALSAPAWAAEEEPLRVQARGVTIVKVDDRCGVLSQVEVAAGKELRARVRRWLLEPYRGFGRLGQVTFWRRTFFVYCRAANGAAFWHPVDLTVLPRCEAAPEGEVAPAGSDAVVRLRLRNNTGHPLWGWLRAARGVFPLAKPVAAGTTELQSVRLPADRLGLLSPGDNAAELVLAGEGSLPLTLTATRLYGENAALRAFGAGRLRAVPLPEGALTPDERWRDVRDYEAFGHMPWASLKPPLEALAGKERVSAAELPGVEFALAGRRFVPISCHSGRPEFTLPLGSGALKKLYLLVIPFLYNTDMHAEVARITLRTAEDRLLTRVLRYPGDLDSWCPAEVVGDFSTARKPRSSRSGLLPTLKPGQALWQTARLPEFPQPELWATCLPLRTASSVMSVVELDLAEPMVLKSLTFSALGTGPGFGLVAVAGEAAGGHERLAGTPWLPPAELRDPRVLFSFEKEGDLRGWQLEGEAFGVAAVASLFTYPTLNSLPRAGERATGTALSPEFTVGQGDRFLSVRLQGGRAEMIEGVPNLSLDVRDGRTGEVLKHVHPPGSHVPVDSRVAVEVWRGRALRLELVDRNTADSYAWIGVRDVRLLGR